MNGLCYLPANWSAHLSIVIQCDRMMWHKTNTLNGIMCSPGIPFEGSCGDSLPRTIAKNGDFFVAGLRASFEWRRSSPFEEAVNPVEVAPREFHLTTKLTIILFVAYLSLSAAGCKQTAHRFNLEQPQKDCSTIASTFPLDVLRHVAQTSHNP